MSLTEKEKAMIFEGLAAHCPSVEMYETISAKLQAMWAANAAAEAPRPVVSMQAKLAARTVSIGSKPTTRRALHKSYAQAYRPPYGAYIYEVVDGMLGISGNRGVLTLDTLLVDLGADDLDMLDIQEELESHYMIRISGETAQNFKTLRDIIEHVYGTQT